ncbi:MAG: hypothetical protein QXZ12_06840, partial [Thermoplasmata archaeon]
MDENNSIMDLIDSYVNRLKNIVNYPLFQTNYFNERQEVPLPEQSPEIKQYFKLRGENVEEAIKYFDSLPIEKRLEIINYDNKMNAMLREKTA